MADITITKLNCTWMKVLCKEKYMELDIQDRFSFEVPNAKYDPRVRSGKWDGVKKLFNRQTKKMHIGLLLELCSFCDKKGWGVYVDPDLLPDDDPLTDDDLNELIKLIQPMDNGQPIEPYDYQLESVKYMLNMERSVVLAATSAGKSLIIYLAVRLYQLMDELQGKTIFITVPSISLVEQLYNDFDNYSKGTDWHVNQYCQKISNKYSKFVEKQVVITTWQSMAKLPYDVFENIGAIFIDETHSASAAVLGSLIEQATNTPIRHGLTGTLDGTECNELIIQGLLGPAKRIVSAKDIIEKGRASDIHVKMTVFEHSMDTRQNFFDMTQSVPPKRKYHSEIEFLNQHQQRRETIKGIIESLSGNTLVLFDRVEEYGQELYEDYKKLYPDTTFLMIGDVGSTEREDIRTGMEDHDNAVIWASYGVASTGISIKKLHNLVLISSSKSKIRVLQSIGRLMRLHATKDNAQIIDIVDDLTYQKEPNYTLKHAQTRLDYYLQEDFKVDFLNLKL